MRGPTSRRSGFTLIEVLVALSVFGVVSVLAYTGLARALETKDRLDRERAFWSQLSLGFVRLDQDFSDARARAATGSGGGLLPAFMARSIGGAPAVEFTRGAPEGLGAHGLQRVGYEFSDHTLWRVTWPAVDRGPGARPTRSALITGLDGASLTYHGENGLTSATWPVDPAFPLPRGVELTLQIPGRGAFTRAFFVHD